jgi:hypothetical protein
MTPVIVSYGGSDGALGWTGSAFRDRVQIGGVDPTVTIGFGAIHSHKGFFFTLQCDGPSGMIDNNYQGLIGLGTSDSLLPGTTSFLDQFAASGATDTLAVRLCHNGGSMWLGGYDPASMSAPPQWAPMGTTHGYTVSVASFEIAGRRANAAAPASSTNAPKYLLDTGGPTLFLPTTAYTTILEALTSDAYFTSKFGEKAWFDQLRGSTSLPIGPDQVNAMLPPLTIHIAATPPFALEVPATDSYISWSYDGAGGYLYFPAMLEVKAPADFFDLGNVLMRSYQVIFDRGQKRVGFAKPLACKI